MAGNGDKLPALGRYAEGGCLTALQGALSSFDANTNDMVHSIPSDLNFRSNCPCSIFGSNLSRNSEPKPRRDGLCEIGLPHSRQSSRNSFLLS